MTISKVGQYIRTSWKVDIVEDPISFLALQVTLTTKDGRGASKWTHIRLKEALRHHYTARELIHKFKTLSRCPSQSSRKYA